MSSHSKHALSKRAGTKKIRKVRKIKKLGRAKRLINVFLRNRRKPSLYKYFAVFLNGKLSLFLILTAVFFFVFPTVYKKIISPRLSFSEGKTNQEISQKESHIKNVNGPIKIEANLLQKKETTQEPLRIVIPTLSIDLPVVEAKVVNGFWELSETSASHGIGSANPGELGNTVIFAHAREGLFLPLRSIKNNDNVYVLSKDHWYRYRVVQTQLVDPDHIQVIAQTKDETLTLFACSGFLDSKRLIVTLKALRP